MSVSSASSSLLHSISHGATRPGADSIDPVDANPRNISRRRVFHGREFHSGSDINLRQFLQEFGRAAFLDAGLTIKHCIFRQIHGSLCAGLERERDSRVALNVLDLLIPGQMGGDHFIAIQTDLHERDLRAAVRVEGNEMGRTACFDETSDFLRDSHGAHPRTGCPCDKLSSILLVAAATSVTAASKAGWLAREGLRYPLTFLTYCSAASRISSSVAL